MEIGITLTPTGSGGAHPHDAARHLLWAARYADEQGFDNVWSTEHHFTTTAFSSAPSVLLGHYAAITERVKLGYAVAIVPLHHPLTLAEEMSWVDNVSNGRLIGGVSPGWSPYEFDVLGVPLSERHERFSEGFAIIRKALTGEKFSFEGRHWQLTDVQVLPPPIQPGGPKFVTATTSDDGVRRAADLKVSPLLGYAPFDGLAVQRQLFIDTCRTNDYPADEIADLLTRLGALRRVIIRDTDAEAEQEAIDSALGFTSGNKKHNTNARGEPVEGILRRAQQPSPDADPRKLFAYTGTIWGTPDTVISKLLGLRDVGVGHVIIQFHSTTRDLDGTKENIRRFATQVLPAYRDAEARSAPPARPLSPVLS